MIIKKKYLTPGPREQIRSTKIRSTKQIKIFQCHINKDFLFLDLRSVPAEIRVNWSRPA